MYSRRSYLLNEENINNSNCHGLIHDNAVQARRAPTVPLLDSVLVTRSHPPPRHLPRPHVSGKGILTLAQEWSVKQHRRMNIRRPSPRRVERFRELQLHEDVASVVMLKTFASRYVTCEPCIVSDSRIRRFHRSPVLATARRLGGERLSCRRAGHGRPGALQAPR